MAVLEFKIPDAQFNVGGRFYGQDKNKVSVIIPVIVPPDYTCFTVTNTIKTIEDYLFFPTKSFSKLELFSLMDKGIIEITISGAPQTPLDITNIIATYYQEL